MKDEFAEYSAYLQDGMRVEVGIPLSGGGVFRDWAIISEFRDDQMLAQISRDVLPANVKVELGSILDVSVWVGKDAYTCSCIVTEKLQAKVFRVRLFGTFTLQERRQFFRLDLDLRTKYATLEGQTPELIKRDWERRIELEHMKSQGYDQYVIAAHQARFPPPLPVEWYGCPSPHVNLGGGGMRLMLSRPVQAEQQLTLELHLPGQPPRIIYTVAEVVHVLASRTVKGKTVYPVGVKFVFLDERDRDLIFQQISVLQIEHLREVADERAFPEPEEDGARSQLSWEDVVKRGVYALVVLVISFCVVRYLIHYSASAPPNEIGSTYEKALKQYRGVE